MIDGVAFFVSICTWLCDAVFVFVTFQPSQRKVPIPSAEGDTVQEVAIAT